MAADAARPMGAEMTGDDPEAALSPPAVRLRVAPVAKLNLADFQNSVPALHELAIVNETASAVSELTIQLACEPAFIQPRTWSLEAVGAGETYHLKDLDVRLDGSLLSRLTEAEPTSA